MQEFSIFYIYVWKHKILVSVPLSLIPNYMNQLNDKSSCPLTVANI